MDALTRSQTELVTVTTNSRFLAKLLDHNDATSSGPEEGELVKEPFNSCIKMLPKLVWLASETEEGDLSNCKESQRLDFYLDGVKIVHRS